MTAEKIALYGGVALSLAISYFPGFKGWFEKLDPLYKRLVLISFLLVIAVGAFVLGLRIFKPQIDEEMIRRGMDMTCFTPQEILFYDNLRKERNLNIFQLWKR